MSELSQGNRAGCEFNPRVEQRERPSTIDLLWRLMNYDPTAPEAEHLRPRQSLAVTRFCEHGSQMLQGLEPMSPMSLIHPTGSGKTVFATELARIVATGPNGHNVLMLVPNLQLLGQTAGNDDDIGEIRSRIPDISVGEYSGGMRSLGNRVTVMNYHMLKTAMRSGHVAQINPKLIILDEVQHLIDGSWSNDVKQITKDTLTVGLTATPMYSEARDSRTNFPVVLDHMTIREGIHDGILSGIRGFTYQGSSRIRLGRSDGKMTDEVIFKAIAASRDNYLVAAICASEVAKGKRGIVSCSPGYDRLHAKIMQKILAQTPVDTPEGRRPINAAYVDGTMGKDEINDILARYHRKKAEIDVIAFVSLLLEGWNSPLTDFGVWARPTPSVVLAEQRIGRLLRRRGSKIAHLHEVMYEVEDGKDRQITLDDVLNGTGSRIGYSVGNLNLGKRNRSPSLAPSIDVSRFAINAVLAAEAASESPVAMQDETIAPERDIVPYDWPTIYVLAKKFNMEYEDAERVLVDKNIATAQDTSGDLKRTFYSPDAYAVLANHLGIPVGVPEGGMTVSQLIYFCRTSDLERVVAAGDLENYLSDLGIEPSYCLEGFNIVKIYPQDVQNMLYRVPGKKVPKRKKREQLSEPHVDVANWLSVILVNPKTAETPMQQRHIRTAQSCLLSILKGAKVFSTDDTARLLGEVEQLNVEPSPQMQNVMAAHSIDFVQLLTLAQQAKDNWLKLLGLSE
jgi:superfamily II DNA or RNA helicase